MKIFPIYFYIFILAVDEYAPYAASAAQLYIFNRSMMTGVSIKVTAENVGRVVESIQAPLPYDIAIFTDQVRKWLLPVGYCNEVNEFKI